MIDRAFELRTRMFEATTPGPHFINPVCFGEDFAAWLVYRLRARSYDPSEPIQEDFGWVVMVPHNGSKFTLAIAIYDDSIAQTPSEWRVTVAYEKPLNSVRSWFRAAPVEDLNTVAAHVEAILRAGEGIEDVRPV
jgi:hypothetical protein